MTLSDGSEFADVIVLNKVDRVDDETLNATEGLLRALNPRAEIVRAHFGRVPLEKVFDTGRFDLAAASESPGWLQTLRGEARSEAAEYGIESFVYRARRPLHPERFWALTGKEWPGVLRSKGFFWIASRMDTMGVWSHAGGACRTEPGGPWLAALPDEVLDEGLMVERDGLSVAPWGDRRQEIVIIGAHMDGHGWGEAANDDGSGTALVMELARIFSMPDVTTERTIRFALWNNEETGLNGARAYVEQRKGLQGKEDPPGSGKYPEPRWLGMIQHDMMLFDHGAPRADGAHQQAQLLTLMGGDLHAPARHARRLLAQPPPHRAVAQPVRIDIVGQGAVDRRPILRLSH